MKIVKYIKEITETSVNDVVKSVLEDMEPINYLNDNSYLRQEIMDILNSNEKYIELSPKEKSEVADAGIVKINDNRRIYKESEIGKLINRKKILSFIQCLLETEQYYNYTEPGKVGYFLKAEQIVDLIIENGNK